MEALRVYKLELDVQGQFSLASFSRLQCAKVLGCEHIKTQPHWSIPMNLAQPSECGRQHTLNSIHGHNAARLQSNANLAV